MELYKGYVYLLQCADGTYYTSSTTDVALSLLKHQSGGAAAYTQSRRPVQLVYFEEYLNIDIAKYREIQWKRWSKKKKSTLVNAASEDMKKAVQMINQWVEEQVGE